MRRDDLLDLFAAIVGIILAVATCVALIGCTQSTRDTKAQQRRHDTWHITGGAGAMAVDLVIDLDSLVDSDSHSEAKSGLDPAAIAALVQSGVKAALAASGGGGLLNQLAGLFPNGSAGPAGAGAALTAAAWYLRKRKRDSDDEEWDEKHAELQQRAAKAEGALAALTGAAAPPRQA